MIEASTVSITWKGDQPRTCSMRVPDGLLTSWGMVDLPENAKLNFGQVRSLETGLDQALEELAYPMYLMGPGDLPGISSSAVATHTLNTRRGITGVPTGFVTAVDALEHEGIPVAAISVAERYALLVRMTPTFFGRVGEVILGRGPLDPALTQALGATVTTFLARCTIGKISQKPAALLAPLQDRGLLKQAFPEVTFA